jgi:hypothetical protein
MKGQTSRVDLVKESGSGSLYFVCLRGESAPVLFSPHAHLAKRYRHLPAAQEMQRALGEFGHKVRIALASNNGPTE